MAAVTIPQGISIVAWIGPITTLTSTSWFNSTNINGIYKQSSNRLSYISCKPGASFPGFTQLIPANTGNILSGYIINAKVAFQLDDSLIAVLGTPTTNPTQLATPTNTLATPTSGSPTTSLTVTANSVANASSYKLYNSATQTGTYSQLGGVLSAPLYTHTGLSAGLIQWYKWLAVGDEVNYLDSAQSLVFSGTTSSSTTQPITYLVAIGGQSNSQGLAPRSELFTGTFKDVTPSFTRQYQKSKVWNPATNQIEKLQVGSVNSSQGYASFLGNEQGQQWPERPNGYEDGFGYMIPLAQQFELQHPTGDAEICFIESSKGATPLARFQDGDTSTNSALFLDLTNKYNSTVAALNSAGRQVIFLGYLFKQGEADGANTNYASDMATYANSIRTKIFGANAKIVIDICKSEPTVAAQQRIWAAQDSNPGVIETSQATRIFDGLHIDAKSIIELGMGQNYNILFGTNVSAPVPASMPGGYGWISYYKSYLPGAAVDRWKTYAGRTSDFDLIQSTSANQFTLTTGRNGITCFRSNGTTSLFTGNKPEDTKIFTAILAVDLSNDNRWQGLLEIANNYMSADQAFKDIYDGKTFYSDHNLTTAVNRISIISYGFGSNTDSAFIRLNGNTVWRGTTNSDGLGTLNLGAVQGNYAKGDFYALLLAQRLISQTEITTVENQLASELGITLTPNPIPTDNGQYYDGQGLLNAKDWINNVAPSAGFKGDSNLVTNTDIKLYGTLKLTTSKTVVFYGVKDSNYGQSTWIFDGQSPIAVDQYSTTSSNGSVELLRFILPAGTYNYVYYRVAGQSSSTYVGFDGFDIIN